MQTTLQHSTSAKGVIMTGQDACQILSQLSDLFSKDENQRVMAVQSPRSISFFIPEGSVTLSVNFDAKGGIL